MNEQEKTFFEQELNCLEQFLGNLRKEQDALCLNEVKTLKEILKEREELFYQNLKFLELAKEQSFHDQALLQKKKALAEKIRLQSVRNQKLLEKKLSLNKALINRLHPSEENPTYDFSGTCKGNVSNRVIINQEV